MATRKPQGPPSDPQLPLFAPPPVATPPPAPSTERARPAPESAPQPSLFAEVDPLIEVHASLVDLAASIPDNVRFGTSSWSFPGWRGIVYSRNFTEAQLARDGLREYARHPLLRTVGIDRGYYAPIPPQDLERYATQLPPGFPCCTKAPEAITATVHQAHNRAQAGEPNPDFLSPERFMTLMGDAFASSFGQNTGPFIFEFPPMLGAHRLHPEVFAERLDRFFSALPRSFSYAVELRDRALLTSSYQRVLATHRVAHTYNYWTAMPMPAAQLESVPIDTAPFTVVRLLLRPGTRYDERKNEFLPFNRLVDVDEAMRNGVVTILRMAMVTGRPIYVLVNNKAEGSAPLTIRAIAEMLAAG
jgi:uncharacterized protein YecE (DUF72 family)